VIIDIESLLMVDITLKCTACRNKSNFCDCEDPKLVWDTFGFILAKQDNIPIYLTVKDFDLLCSLLDVTTSEIDQTMDYVRRFGEFKVYNETLKSKAFDMKKIFSFFSKIPSKKAVYGTFAAKKDKVKGMDDNIVPDYVRGQGSQMDASNYLFSNGIIKVTNTPEKSLESLPSKPDFVLTYHLIVQYCERIAPTSVSNLLYKSIFSQL
jgi:hypothetical protein